MAKKSGIIFNMRRWSEKSDLIKLNLKMAVKESVDYGMDLITKEAARNLSGPHYGKETKYRGPATGTMPIPRITANLARSLSQDRLRSDLGVVYAAKNVANYAGIVHDGYPPGTYKKGKNKGKKYPGMRPRRFLHDAVMTKRSEILKNWRANIKSALRRGKTA